MAAIALTTLGATGPPAASPAPATAAHVKVASAASQPRNGTMRVLKRGLVKDCEEIQLGDTNWQLWDNGAYNLVSLSPAPASCWNLLDKTMVY